jgi:hypothetical protein
MNLTEKEKFYDTEIAPKLLELTRSCTEHELSLICQVEWNPNRHGITHNVAEKSSFIMKMALILAKTNGNLDAFVMSVLRFAKKEGVDTSESLVAYFMGGSGEGK